MARKTKVVRIEAAGRDQGKSFLITELPASQAERWATRALMAMAKTGVDIPEGIENAGMAGLASIGLRALASIPYEDAEPLLATMFECVKFVSPTHPEVSRYLIEDDIEEVGTRLQLRREVLELHTGFSFTDALQGSRTTDAKLDPETLSSSTMPTSRLQ